MTGLMLAKGFLQLPHTLERRTLLCAIALVSLLRIADSQSPQCNTAVPPAQRVDCGASGITQADCEGRFCCFDTTRPLNAIWCYYPNQLQRCSTPIDGVSRTNCNGAFPGIGRGQCTAFGCCFDDSQAGFPFCYNSAYEVRECSNTILPASRTPCQTLSPPFTSVFECKRVGCCYDDTFGLADPNTFCYQPMPSNVIQACSTSIPSNLRISCGSLNVAECTERGCCHDGAECYHRVGQNPLCAATSIAVEFRRECGYTGISGRECALQDCCFDAASSGIQCYTPYQLECTSVPAAARIDCGYGGIGQEACQNPSCCFDSTEMPFCFYPVDQVTPRPANPGCRLDDLFESIGDTLQLWVRLVRDPPSAEGILNKTSIFSITTYCGIYTTSIDAITGCAFAIINPFQGINPNFDTSFINAMNDIQDAKGVCAAVVKQDPGRPLCVPNAHAICGLTSIDLLTSFSTRGQNNAQLCRRTEEILRGVSTCIGLSTSGCTQAQQDGYADVRLQFVKIADRIATNCQNCTALSYFLLDRHESCSWNFKRIFPNPQALNYCEYATRAVTCAWDLWKGCPILPREYFERALSALDNAFLLGGCNSFLPRIPDFAFNPNWEINLPPCVEAGITCAQQLSYAVGVGELAGPFGGYTFDQVRNRVNIIRDELLQGNYQGLCGRPSQQSEGKNPISDCINDLFNNCGGDSATMQQMEIVNTTVVWYREACTDGCTRLAEKFLNFRTSCPDAEFTVAPEEIPTQLFLSQVPSVTDGVGARSELCQNIWSYVGCISDIIRQCTFLHNRLEQAMQKLVEVITGDTVDPMLPLNIHICGIRIFYPFTYDPSKTIFQISLGPQTTVPLHWLISLSALLTTVYTMFL